MTRTDAAPLTGTRKGQLQRRIRWVVAATISYNVIEAIIAITAGAAASSAALVAFGLDSIVEVLSAAAVAWQFSTRDPEKREKTALRAIAFSFFALAAYVLIDTTLSLFGSPEAEHSPVGIVLATVSLIVMPALSWFERRTGRELGSATAIADSKQTLLCAYLSAALLIGLLLNTLLGWAWADSVAAVVIAGWAIKEGIEAWQGESCAVPVAALTGERTVEHDHHHGAVTGTVTTTITRGRVVGDGHNHGAVHSANRTRLAVAFGITATILIAEVIGAIITGSLALIVDAAHMLTDAGGLLVALLASSLTLRPATSARTWGFARVEVLAATLQSAVLLGVGLFVLIEGIRRLYEPPEIPADGLLLFGVIGLIGNVISIIVLFAGRASNFNMRGAFLEVINDALGSVGVIIAAIVITVTGWQGADAVAAILIGILILPRAFTLLRETTGVLLESTPAGLDLDDLRTHLLELPHVQGVHDLHATQIATGLPVLTAHVIVDRECFHPDRAPQLLDQLQACVAEHFEVSIEHSTFQLEPETHQEHEHAPHL